MRTLSSLVVMLLLMSAAYAQNPPKRVDIITMVDTPQLLEVERGIVEGLRDLGIPEGKGVTIDFKSAAGNFGTAQQIVRGFVGDQPDVIVPITTAPAQAAVAATKDIPIVFTSVTDPLRARIVSRVKRPGGNVTGISDEVPYERQIDLIKQIVPGMKRLGIVYDPGLDSALSSVDKIKALAPELGLTIVLSSAVDGNSVAAAGQNLVGRVDAMYVPNDTTVTAALESLVKVAQDAQLPLFTGERRSVGRGAIASIGFDYGQVGKVTARMVKQVLDGDKPSDIDVVYMKSLEPTMTLFVNKTSAAKMGVTIPPAILAEASQVF